MPEQPADPLHYEMKIPPEKHSSKDKEDADNSNHPDREEKPDVVKAHRCRARSRRSPNEAKFGVIHGAVRCRTQLCSARRNALAFAK